MIKQVEIEWYESILPELEVVFDVGCKNDSPFYDLNPSMDIHLFDPQPQNTKGTFNQIALSDKKGKHKYYPEYGSLNKRNLKGDKWRWLKHDSITVQTDTVDNYCQEKGIKKIDLLKIDAEGWDYYVLLGAKRMLPYIRYIQFEHWSDELTGKICELLSDYDISELGGKPLNYKATR